MVRSDPAPPNSYNPQLSKNKEEASHIEEAKSTSVSSTSHDPEAGISVLENTTSTRAKEIRTKSLSLEISSELHKTLKILALEQDDTLNSFIIDALKQYIKNEADLNMKAEAVRKRLV